MTATEKHPPPAPGIPRRGGCLRHGEPFPQPSAPLCLSPSRLAQTNKPGAQPVTAVGPQGLFDLPLADSRITSINTRILCTYFNGVFLSGHSGILQHAFASTLNFLGFSLPLPISLSQQGGIFSGFPRSISSLHSAGLHSPRLVCSPRKLLCHPLPKRTL